jgi:hypothetical protein
MKILVLGDSGSSGAFNDGRSWAEVMRRHLSEEIGGPVEVEHETFVASGERAPGIAAKRVTEHDPDLVLLTVANYVFSVPFV